MVNFDKLNSEKCRRNFYFFIQKFWGVIIPEQPIWNWHIKYLADELQKCAERVIRGEKNEYDLLINIPPGTTKTTIAVVMFPAWIWIRYPQARILTLNYSATGSTDKSTLSKDIIKSDLFKLYFSEIQIRQDIDNKEIYKNTKGGERVAKGVKGSVLSGHYHFIIFDDPLNITEAESKLKRDTINSMVNKIGTTRKVDKAISFTVYIQQRLHESDPSGMLLARNSDKIKHINLPAKDNGKIKPQNLKEYYVNGFLDPIRLNDEILKEQLIGLGSYDYSGQFMQEPTPSEGGMIKKDWFKIVDNDFIDKIPVWNFEIDGAFTSDIKNDQSAILCWGVLDNQMYIRNVIGVWEETNDFIKTIKEFVYENGYTNASRIYIENKASGIVFLQVLKNQTSLNVIGEIPKASKEERVKPILPFLESGRCNLIKGGWNDSFIDQCGVFPRGKLKDKVDCLSASINRFLSQDNKVQGWVIG